jgi:peptide/nickel transport system ATP-binding protein
MPEILLEARGLNVWFDDEHGGPPAHAVRGVDVVLRAGQRSALVGESGSGKSTTLHALLGLLPQSATVGGSIEICGEPALLDGESGFRHHRWTDVAMVFQGAMSSMNPVRTVGAQIKEVLALRGGVRGKAAGERVEELLGLVDLRPAVASSYPHQLSGGMRQRASIAMALACNPKVLLADEPTTALDAIVATDVAAMLSGLCDRLGLALLLVSHDLGLACSTCEDVSVMQDGVVVEQGAPSDLIAAPKHPYTGTLFSAVADLSDARTGARELPQAPEPVLRIEGLRVEYDPPRSAWRGDRTPICAVDDVALEVGRGEFVALIGESGSGKTSLAQSVLQLVRPRGGRVMVADSDVVTARGRELRGIRRSVQMIFQDPYGSLDPRMTVRTLIEEPLEIHGIAEGADARAERVREALESAGLAPAERYLDRFPHQLSGGERQRVALASAIVVKPALLIADEPVSMLDVSLRAGILQLLDDLRREHELSLLMITHDIATAMRHADRVAVMLAGRIVEIGTTHEVVANPRHEYTKALLAAVPQRTPRERRDGVYNGA